jgi:hypothetical protein
MARQDQLLIENHQYFFSNLPSVTEMLTDDDPLSTKNIYNY